MSLQSAVLMGIGIYFLMMLWIAYSTKKHETEDDFVIGSRKVGIIPTVASIASGLRDGAGIVVWVGLGFLLGYAGILWLILGLTIGTILLGLYGPRMRDLAAKNSCITIGQMVRHFIGSRTAKYISFIIILFSTLVIAMQLFVAGNLISKIADIAPVFGILFSALVVAMYLMSGGYKAVIKTDTLQFFIILSLIFIPLFIQPKLVDMKDLSTVFAMGTENNIAILIIGVMYMLAGADIWQRIFSAKDGKTIVKSISMFPIFLFIMTLSLMWLGMGARNFVTTTNSDDVLFLLFKSPEIPVAVLAYIAIVIISITMSTLDTYTYLLSSTYLEDFTKYDVKKHKK
ncbi:MAG: hypothetical protein N4A44_00810 [Alphaproteobacteria bacterium]|jgi:SSS family solute:Na+ symporter|nr:hypothetical protein [Alphaproteobacteria bacterium]